MMPTYEPNVKPNHKNMDKKVMKAMYAYIVSKDQMRPMMTGVFFDKNAIVASDAKVLVKYKIPGGKFTGKILAANGEEISGKYPNYERVFPSVEGQYFPPIDLEQLQKAIAWFTRQPGFTEDDTVLMEGKGVSIKRLGTLLNILVVGNDIKKAKMAKTQDGQPVVIHSPKFDALLMPMNADESKADNERVEDCPLVITLENLINQYVFEGWRPKTVEDPMSWLD